jgi:hypothetical protein
VHTTTPYEGVAVVNFANSATMAGLFRHHHRRNNETVLTFFGSSNIGSGAPSSSTPSGWTNDVLQTQSSPFSVFSALDHKTQASR